MLVIPVVYKGALLRGLEGVQKRVLPLRFLFEFKQQSRYTWKEIVVWEKSISSAINHMLCCTFLLATMYYFVYKGGKQRSNGLCISSSCFVG